MGRGAGCAYTLHTAATLTAAPGWTCRQTAELEHLGGGRHQFIVPTAAEAQRYYRIVVWTPGSTDTDHDGLADSLEISLRTNGNRFDTDGDGFSDGLEATLHRDPLHRNSVPPASAFPQAEFAPAETVVMEGTALCGSRCNSTGHSRTTCCTW